MKKVIGGEGKIVQIDESHIYTRKYHTGGVLRKERKQIWVFGEFRKTTIMFYYNRAKQIKIPFCH